MPARPRRSPVPRRSRDLSTPTDERPAVRATGRWYAWPGRRRSWLERSELTDCLDAQAASQRQQDRGRDWRALGGPMD